MGIYIPLTWPTPTTTHVDANYEYVPSWQHNRCVQQKKEPAKTKTNAIFKVAYSLNEDGTCGARNKPWGPHVMQFRSSKHVLFKTEGFALGFPWTTLSNSQRAHRKGQTTAVAPLPSFWHVDELIVEQSRGSGCPLHRRVVLARTAGVVAVNVVLKVGRVAGSQVLHLIGQTSVMIGPTMSSVHCAAVNGRQSEGSGTAHEDAGVVTGIDPELGAPPTHVLHKIGQTRCTRLKFGTLQSPGLITLHDCRSETDVEQGGGTTSWLVGVLDAAAVVDAANAVVILAAIVVSCGGVEREQRLHLIGHALRIA